MFLEVVSSVNRGSDTVCLLAGLWFRERKMVVARVFILTGRMICQTLVFDHKTERSNFCANGRGNNVSRVVHDIVNVNSFHVDQA